MSCLKNAESIDFPLLSGASVFFRFLFDGWPLSNNWVNNDVKTAMTPLTETSNGNSSYGSEPHKTKQKKATYSVYNVLHKE